MWQALLRPGGRAQGFIRDISRLGEFGHSPRSCAPKASLEKGGGFGNPRHDRPKEAACPVLTGSTGGDRISKTLWYCGVQYPALAPICQVAFGLRRGGVPAIFWDGKNAPSVMRGTAFSLRIALFVSVRRDGMLAKFRCANFRLWWFLGFATFCC